jgi:hypothetical protein
MPGRDKGVVAGLSGEVRGKGLFILGFLRPLDIGGLSFLVSCCNSLHLVKTVVKSRNVDLDGLFKNKHAAMAAPTSKHTSGSARANNQCNESKNSIFHAHIMHRSSTLSSKKCKSKNHTLPLASHGAELALSGKKEKKGFRGV